MILFAVALLIFTGCPFRKKDKYLSQFDYLTSNVTDLRFIAEENVLTRKDAAYLFSIYFPLTVKVESMEIPFDVKMYPYPSLICSAVKRGMINLYPDSTFRPDEIVYRYQLAILLSKYVLTVDPFFDANFRIAELNDVDESFFAYKPISMMVSSGVMEAKNDSFYPNAPVSGYDALRFFHRIREFYR